MANVDPTDLVSTFRSLNLTLDDANIYLDRFFEMNGVARTPLGIFKAWMGDLVYNNYYPTVVVGMTFVAIYFAIQLALTVMWKISLSGFFSGLRGDSIKRCPASLPNR